RLVEGDRSTGDPLREIIALDELHHEGGDAPALFEPVDRGDMGMIQRGERLRLPLEARDALGVAGERFGQDLDRDVAIQLVIAGAIDLAHAARAKRRDDLIRSETRAAYERHGIAVNIRPSTLSRRTVARGACEMASGNAQI